MATSALPGPVPPCPDTTKAHTTPQEPEQPPLLSSLPRHGGSLGVQADLTCALGSSINNGFSGESLHVSFGNPCGGRTPLTPMTCGRGILRPAPAWHGSGPALGVRDEAVRATETRCREKKRADDRGQAKGRPEQWEGKERTSVPPVPWGSSDSLRAGAEALALQTRCTSMCSYMCVQDLCHTCSQGGHSTVRGWQCPALAWKTLALVLVTRTGVLKSTPSAGAAS